MRSIHLFFILFVLASCSTTQQATTENTMSAVTTTTIYLVRHAEKADDGTNDPPLTAEGRKRAELLAEILKEKRITHIFSSDYKRTKETAIPTSRNTKVAIASYDPRNLPAISDKLKTLKNQNILVVGHSNSTPSLANEILGQEDFVQFDESDYDNLLVITIKNGQASSKRLEFTLNQVN